MKICLDTNGYSAYMKGDPAVRSALEEADAVLVPSVVIGELCAGFAAGTRYRRNLDELKEFLDAPGIEEAHTSFAVAERYGMLVADLRKKGAPVPTNDLWIAAIALEAGARVLTFDRHFDRIPGIVTVPL